MIDCIAAMQGTSAIGIEGLGAIDMRGGSYSVPASYASSTGFVDFIVSRVSGVTFTQLLSDVGGFAFVFARNAIISGCKFRVTDNGAAALTYATGIVSGSFLVSNDNDFGTDSGGYCFPCLGTGAARGSSIQLIPATRQTTAGGTLVLQSHYESVGAKYTGTSPTFQLAPPKFEGQKLHVTFINLSGGPLGFGLSGYGYKATPSFTPAHNQGASATFVASDPTDSGTLVWSQVGDWAQLAA
jgi:hypothetical protein